MSWKEDIKTIVDMVARLEKQIRVLQGQTAINSKRIGEMRTLLDNQIKNQSRAADRMADRIIEMAMVNQGRTLEAASHRRTLQETPEEGVDLWQDGPETQWPPPGTVAVNLP